MIRQEDVDEDVTGKDIMGVSLDDNMGEIIRSTAPSLLSSFDASKILRSISKSVRKAKGKRIRIFLNFIRMKHAYRMRRNLKDVYTRLLCYEDGGVAPLSINTCIIFKCFSAQANCAIDLPNNIIIMQGKWKTCNDIYLDDHNDSLVLHVELIIEQHLHFPSLQWLSLME